MDSGAGLCPGLNILDQKINIYFKSDICYEISEQSNFLSEFAK